MYIIETAGVIEEIVEQDCWRMSLRIPPTGSGLLAVHSHNSDAALGALSHCARVKLAASCLTNGVGSNLPERSRPSFETTFFPLFQKPQTVPK